MCFTKYLIGISSQNLMNCHRLVGVNSHSKKEANGTPQNHIATVYVKLHDAEVSKRKSYSYVDFEDDHSITKLFLRNYIYVQYMHVIRCKRIYYETFPPNIPGRLNSVAIANLQNFAYSKLYT